MLLLEAGGRDRDPLFRLPMLMGKLFRPGIYNWHYHTEPEPHLNGRSLYWPRGKVLGGTSTINGMIYVRGNRHDYDRWSQLGLPGWSYDEVLPAFRRSEAHIQRNDPYHNGDGELTVCRARGHNPLMDVLSEAGSQAGYPLNDDFNGETQEGWPLRFHHPQGQALVYIVGLPPAGDGPQEPHRDHRGGNDACGGRGRPGAGQSNI